jgi:hypothetical protein
MLVPIRGRPHIASLSYNIMKQGRGICRLVKRRVIRSDQGLLFFKRRASLGAFLGRDVNRKRDI